MTTTGVGAEEEGEEGGGRPNGEGVGKVSAESPRRFLSFLISSISSLSLPRVASLLSRVLVVVSVVVLTVVVTVALVGPPRSLALRSRFGLVRS